jgi:energy-coupling factor transporter ATP-binding protein EcfA2
MPPTLSFAKDDDKARPIARVKGGNNDGDILYLNENGAKDARKQMKRTIDRSKYASMLKEMKPAEKTKTFVRLEEALHRGTEPSSMDEKEPVKGVYERMWKDSHSDKTIELDDEGQFELLPNPDPKKREVWYIAGQSGSGKSYIAKSLASYYKKLFPEREVYLISKLKEDATLDALKFLKRLNIQSFIDDYPDLDEFKDCLCVFDDYDTLTGDAEKVVLKLVDDIAIMGRHTNTSMLCLSHYLTNYKKTRLILTEATHIVVYPQSTSYHAMRYLLKNQVGLDEDDLKRYRKFGSRWICFVKGFPTMMISQKNAEILNQP